MKLFQSIVTERKKKGDTSWVKVRPILLVAHDVKDAILQLEGYWGKVDYKWTRPNMIADFNPK